MSKQRKRSINHLANVISAALIILVTVNIISVMFIGLIYKSMQDSEQESTDFFGAFNTYALQVLSSGNSPTPEIKELFSEIIGITENINSSGAILRPPVYSTAEEKELYSDDIRSFAVLVRDNLSAQVERSYLIIGLLFVGLIVVGFVILGIMIVFRHSVTKYQSEISHGLSSLKKTIQLENLGEFVKIESEITEIDELNEVLFSLSNDVSYNYSLIENNTIGSLETLMNNLYESFCEVMPCDRIALAFIDSNGTCTAETAVTSYKNPSLRPGHREKLSGTSLSKLILTGKPRIINNLDEYAASRDVSYSTKLIMQEGLKSSITLPMMFDGKCLGFFFVSSRKIDAFSESSLSYVKRVISLLKQKLYIEFVLQEVISETSNAFVGLMEEKDNETSSHIMRMSRYAYITAMAYHETVSPLAPRFMREILWYAPMHDIGKVGIPDSILLKEGPLTKDEMTVMKGHVAIGCRVVEKMNERLRGILSTQLMNTAVEIIGGHHEKYNGKGYPEGLSGTEIPLAGRIVAVADVFDALTSKRPYKEAFSIEKALEIMGNDMADSFDPEVFSAFKQGLPEIKEVYERLKEV